VTVVTAATGFDRWAERTGPPNLDAVQIPGETIGALSERLRGRSPRTTGEIVQSASYSSLTTLKRDLGIFNNPSAATRANPLYTDTIDVDIAGRILRALGVYPCEVPWL
jgi:hypothetical protein